MKIILIHPGASFSTHDVFTGMKAGLEANGVEVVPYQLDATLTFFQGLIDIGIENDFIVNPVNPFAFASTPAAALAMWHQPDAVIAVSGGNFHMATAYTIQRGGIKTAVYCTESPYFDKIEHSFARAYDVVFTNERRSVSLFTQNERVYYLPHAFNPEVHHPGPSTPGKTCDAFFVGTGFDERKRLFDGANWDGIHFVKLGYLWEHEESPDTIRPDDVTPNEETAQWYRGAKVCINQHRTTTTYGSGGHINADAASSVGPRAYEIAACGGFQLCDDSRAEYRELFGDATTTYRAGNSADLEAQIRYWLARDDERQALARAQHQAIQPHNWTNRAAQMLDMLFHRKIHTAARVPCAVAS